MVSCRTELQCARVVTLCLPSFSMVGYGRHHTAFATRLSPKPGLSSRPGKLCAHLGNETVNRHKVAGNNRNLPCSNKRLLLKAIILRTSRQNREQDAHAHQSERMCEYARDQKRSSRARLRTSHARYALKPRNPGGNCTEIVNSDATHRHCSLPNKLCRVFFCLVTCT